MSEGTGATFDNGGSNSLNTYETSVLSNAKPAYKVEVLNAQPNSFQFRIGADSINDAVYNCTNIISEHISLGETGFSDPEGFEFQAYSTDKNMLNRDKPPVGYPPMLVRKVTYSTDEAEPLLNIRAVDPSTIEVSADEKNFNLLNFAKSVVSAGLPSPQKKYRPTELEH